MASIETHLLLSEITAIDELEALIGVISEDEVIPDDEEDGEDTA